MITLTKSIVLHAGPERVWEALSEFDKYPEWNPYIQEATGDWEVGEKWQWKLQLATGNAFAAYPKVQTVKENEKLVAMTKLYFSGFLDVEHCFELEANSNHRTTLHYYQTWKGFLRNSMHKKLGKETEDAMEDMLKALKKRVKK